jgi:hypothetical protein
VLILIMRVVDIFWVVVPVTRHPIAPILTDAAGALFAVGAFLAGFSYWVTKAPIIPLYNEPLTQEVVAHG